MTSGIKLHLAQEETLKHYEKDIKGVNEAILEASRKGLINATYRFPDELVQSVVSKHFGALGYRVSSLYSNQLGSKFWWF